MELSIQERLKDLRMECGLPLQMPLPFPAATVFV